MQTIDLVAIANRAGYDAQHIAHIGKAGWKDWNVAAYAQAANLILVTNNAGDFRRLCAAQPIHAGLIIIIPNVNRVLLRQLFYAAIEELGIRGETTNRIIEISLNGDEITLDIDESPSDLASAVYMPATAPAESSPASAPPCP